MSVPLPSSKWCDKTPSSPSVGKTPPRKRRSKGGYGDNRSQPCAEFHGKRKALPSYAASHSCFDPKDNFGLKPYQQAFPDQADRYIKRVPLPLPPDNPTSGIVGPEPDYSVRGRNLPIIFCKQIRHAAQYARMSHDSGHPVWKAILLLFCDPDRTLPGHERPNAGCHQTRRWTDVQVQTWTKLANWLGIRYSGQREYAFPKGSLGVVRHGAYHHNDRTLSSFPWPGKNGTQATEMPKFRFERNRKRSSLSRVLRSIKRTKSIGVTPISIGELIVSRKIIPSSKVYSAYNHDMPISSFKETIPTVLSLKYGPALQLSEIVMCALGRIYSSPKKFMPDKAWLVPQSTNLEYSLSVPKIMGQRAVKRTSTRLRPFFSADGNVYALPYFNGNRHMFAPGNEWRPILERRFPGRVPDFEKSGELFEKYSDMIDDYESGSLQVPGVLGSWA